MLNTNEFHEALTRRLEMENGTIWASNILDNKIYLGAGRDAKNLEQLLNYKITHIINCADDVENYYENYYDNQDNSNNNDGNDNNKDTTTTTVTTNTNTNTTSPKFTYLNLNIRDFGTDCGISRVFQTAADFVKNSLNDENNKILIHCANGTNRSVTVTIAVLMILKGWRLSTAWNYVSQQRPESAPLRDNRAELLRFELALYSKNSMIEAHARLIEIPISKSPNIIVRLATGTLDEAAQCLNIYTPIVYDTTITFEVIPPTVEEFAARMTKCLEKYPWLLAYHRVTNEIVGYAYASFFKERAAYRWSVESSIYVSSLYSRAGIATHLYDCLFACLKYQNIVNVIAVIALPNDPSIQLHEKYSFKTVGIFRNIGYKHEKWIDVAYLQKFLQPPPRYSPTITKSPTSPLSPNGSTRRRSKFNEGRLDDDNEISEENENNEINEPINMVDCSDKIKDLLKYIECSKSSCHG